MNFQSHLVISALAGGGLAAATGEPELAGIAVAAGVLPDVDHLLDYYNWYIRRAPDRTVMLFHGWEYLVLGLAIYAAAGTETWLLAIVIGYATHIGGDKIHHRTRWATYLLAVRAYRGFRWEELVEQRPADVAYRSLLASLPVLRRPVREWFVRRVSEFPDRAARRIVGPAGEVETPDR